MKKENLLGLFLMLLFVTTIFSTGSCDNLINLESKETIQFDSLEAIPGGNGKADEVINWINIKQAISKYYSYLKYNPTNERIAIIDSGLDEPTWTYYEDMIGESWLDIKLFDTNGQEIQQNDATDNDIYNHHGTTIFSLLVQILESYNCIKVGISIYKAGESWFPRPFLVATQLNRIYTWNIQHPNEKIKVISLSYSQFYDYDLLAEAIDNLVNDQGCIIVSASGNYASSTQRTPEYAHSKENDRRYPATYNDVFGVGGIYGFDSSTKENFRMSTQYSITTGDGKYVGSKYYDDHGYSQATVDLVSPGYKVDVICDWDKDGDIDSADWVEATGTSFSTPQVAVAAYLASRLYHALNPSSPFTKYEFLACITHSSENDPEGRTAPDKIHWEEVGEPQYNLGSYTVFYSYRVGYGSLDVYDMLEYIADLS